jgi:chorismate synthase
MLPRFDVSMGNRGYMYFTDDVGTSAMGVLSAVFSSVTVKVTVSTKPLSDGTYYADVDLAWQHHSGGTNGGITNGNELVFRVAVKPPSSIRREQESVDLRTGLPVRFSVPGRHDVCTALRIPVIVEAAAAVVLADLMLRQQLLSRTAR